MAPYEAGTLTKATPTVARALRDRDERCGLLLCLWVFSVFWNGVAGRPHFQTVQATCRRRRCGPSRSWRGSKPHCGAVPASCCI